MQRRIEPHDSLDDYPTPPWATRALCEFLGDTSELVCREPAANRGHMVRPLQEAFKEVHPSDIYDYGAGYPVHDYLFGKRKMDFADWTITNPPFRLAKEFILKAQECSEHGVAMIVRTAFLEGIDRYNTLFKYIQPSDILQFTERVVMHRGKLTAKGSTATAYCWLVWRNCYGVDFPRFHWIAPCRKRLELSTDYPNQEETSQ
ncbi:MAG: methyltransferase [Sneathiella sp.]|nr:MAG: methyltransferase [Sneathiella sp.]